MLTRTPEEILKLYAENGDGLDATSYEVVDLCRELIRIRDIARELAAEEDWSNEHGGKL